MIEHRVPNAAVRVTQPATLLPAPDDITQVVGSRFFWERYSDRRLRDLLLGVHSRDLVHVSRFYMHCRPQVVVDFEPGPGDERFFCEEKRKYFNAQGIVYVPIFLKERLDTKVFRERFETERQTMLETRHSASPKVLTEGDLDPSLVEAIRAQADIQAFLRVERGETKESDVARVRAGIERDLLAQAVVGLHDAVD